MFRKYEKTFRVGGPPNKRSLTKTEVKQLLGGKIDIEEKLDGANVGIIRHKNGFHLQKRGSLVGQSEHEQFQFFHAWANGEAWERIQSIPPGHIFYGEWLRCVHTIYYDRLPDWFICFDVWDGRRFLSRDERVALVDSIGFSSVPLVASGTANSVQEILDLVPTESDFGDLCEGVVIKKYHKKKGLMKGKIVNDQFYDKMDEKHWVTLPVRYNKVTKIE